MALRVVLETMSMTPEVLARLERLSARTEERALVGMDAFVETDGRRVLEPLATDAALARVVGVVPVEVVLLQVDFEFETDVADGAAMWTQLIVHSGVLLKRPCRSELFSASDASDSSSDVLPVFFR